MLGRDGRRECDKGTGKIMGKHTGKKEMQEKTEEVS